MNKAIAHILKQQLTGIPLITRMAGLVQTAEYQDTTFDDSGITPKTINKRIPVSCDTNDSECTDTSLVPDKSAKGILYFEDNGAVFLGTAGRLNKWRSRLRMVCWFNGQNIIRVTDGEYNEDFNDDFSTGGVVSSVACYDVASQLINYIVGRLSGLNAANRGDFLRLQVGIEGIPRQNRQLFAEYTYDLYNTQYLLYPYEYFAIDLAIEYQMHPDCMPAFQYQLQEIDCG